MHESGEDYIETIYLLKKKKGLVRSIDVANELNFSRPSVSRAVGILKEDGLITVESDGELVLTEAGLKKAKSVYEKHTNLTKFLMMTTGVNETIAENDACRIEHIISPETFRGIKRYIKEHKES
ncbi:metal-dependent transcriptional regulator [Butyrivibrio sp. YAB3001]|uniref:metal-dependent transcriptional regulator n=1 Tax=Butyrivibrio sp. YAB3001 TaxID=1520812 RepID=UPI0008F67DA1|nr:metal-dependent transcriptional regulator [Butyrivibrio sp. YAB3001]SFC36071.1 iron (metal) dependent repressor, DtxR family [Butyrivibrio sp. YAB3001]